MYLTYVKNRLQNQKWSKKVKNGQELKVINTEDGWSKIELNGKEVFVSSEFTKDVYHVTANLLNVRTEANTDSEILAD